MSGRRPVRAAFVTVALAMIAPAACSSAERPAPLVAGSGAPVVVPGAPGEPGRTAEPGQRLGESQARAAAQDVRFAEAMIPHHRQAIEMAGLAAARTDDPSVTAMAGRIATGQGPEVTVMTSWLEALGRPAPEAHDHMPGGYGMATPDELNRLREARGSDFDRLFLSLMIRHHEGALRMAGEELRAGRDRAMLAMAQDVMSGQQVEITRMRRILDGV
ncbi:DUF305 domain-containing protein [Microbispora corallina]|uniref:Lipoprotein n=2 Tax=Microbispora corallina TaxID=83302 RepID=A0ABQ4FUR7_9ACTN|nr:lipoprotein [Microbispora corallina]